MIIIKNIKCDKLWLTVMLINFGRFVNVDFSINLNFKLFYGNFDIILFCKYF